MIRQISINTKSLTPALAKEFATMNSVPGERDLKPIRCPPASSGAVLTHLAATH